ncbi:MAG: hypothetical protein EON54_22070 [Alcaligenaceae bacterium]|nr:MAG: hypothetical protein EON54_22070 [Alcaligenaceae bacterium]
MDAANKEGGAHVQGDPPESVVELRRGMQGIISVKIGGIEVGSPLNYHFVLLRQFAHELLNSKDFLNLAVSG